MESRLGIGTLGIAIVTVLAAQAMGADGASIGALPSAYWLAPVGAVMALLMAFYFYKSIMTASEGEPEMIRIAQAVREGAYVNHPAACGFANPITQLHISQSPS